MKRFTKTLIKGTALGNEPYYNMLRVCEITGYADPVAALASTGECLVVVKDENNNILSGKMIASPHADGDFGYYCGSPFCRCSQ